MDFQESRFSQDLIKGKDLPYTFGNIGKWEWFAELGMVCCSGASQ